MTRRFKAARGITIRTVNKADRWDDAMPWGAMHPNVERRMAAEKSSLNRFKEAA